MDKPMSDWRDKGLKLIDLQGKRERIFAEYIQQLEHLSHNGPELPREEIPRVCGFIAQRLEDLFDANEQIGQLVEEFKRGAR